MEKDQNLATQARYTDFPGRWGGLSSQRRGSVSSFYGVDPQANVRVLADSTGAVSDSYLFSAFGEELASSGATINPLRFGGLVGYYRDITNRMYVRARYLNSLQASWLSRDPLAITPDYKYVNQRPTVFLDPLGLAAISDGGGDSCQKCFIFGIMGRSGRLGTPQNSIIG
jgi:RHS repeat-associated protein